MRETENKEIFFLSLYNIDRTTSCHKSMGTHSDEWQPLLYLIYVTRGREKKTEIE